MKRSWRCTFGLLALLLAAPAWAQETVFGVLEPPLGGLNGASGAFTLTGWALADSGVRRVVVQVDGIDIGQANYGLRRPDVEIVFPGFPDSAEGGFGYQLNSTDFLNGLHDISIKVQTNAGTSRVVSIANDIQFTNTTHDLKPFGEIDFPLTGANLFGTCDPLSPTRRISLIEGWVLDLGIEIGDTGVGYVELLIDGSIRANSRFDCRFDPFFGGITDCYGLLRPDVENGYPFAFDAPNAGYRFAIDVGALLFQGGLGGGYAQGSHVLTIRSGDISNQVANVEEIQVNFWCEGVFGNEGAFGFIETPREGRQFAGNLTIEGWALDAEGVDRVEISIDGIFRGLAAYGVAGRASVRSRYPGFPDSNAPVWRFNFDTRLLSDGFHDVKAFVVDENGVGNLIGEVRFFVNNEFPD